MADVYVRRLTTDIGASDGQPYFYRQPGRELIDRLMQWSHVNQGPISNGWKGRSGGRGRKRRRRRRACRICKSEYFISVIESDAIDENGAIRSRMAG